MHDQQTFDVVIIGSGPSARVCAAEIASGDMSVAMIEPNLVGGECPYVGCMPSKALVRPGQLLDEVRRVRGLEEAAATQIDVSEALLRRDAAAYNSVDSVHAQRISDRGVTVIRGFGSIIGEREVRVTPVDGPTVGAWSDVGLIVSEPMRIQARHAVVLASGTVPFIPDIDGLANTPYWTNVQGTLSNEVPRSLVVLGGGPIGCELAQAWRSLGAESVTIVQSHDRLLPHDEAFASDMVAISCQHMGIDVALGERACDVSHDGAAFTVTTESSASFTADKLLIAAGRRGNTASVGLEAVGVDVNDRGFVATDDLLHVGGINWLYGLGDVNGRALFTHTGQYHAQIVGRNIRTGSREPVRDLALPMRVTFTEPQVAAVGHTEHTATVAGLDFIIVDRQIDRTAAASFYGKGAPARARCVFDTSNGKDAQSVALIGATFVGPHVAEMIHAASIAISGNVCLDDLRHAVAPFPTLSQIWPQITDEAMRQLQIW